MSPIRSIRQISRPLIADIYRRLGSMMLRFDTACPPWLRATAAMFGILVSIITNVLFVGDFAVRHLSNEPASDSSPSQHPLVVVREDRSACDGLDMPWRSNPPIGSGIIVAHTISRLGPERR